MVAAKNSLVIKGGYAPNQFTYGRTLGLPNITGKLKPVSTELGGAEYLRHILEGMRKPREIHMQQKSNKKIKRTPQN